MKLLLFIIGAVIGALVVMAVVIVIAIDGITERLIESHVGDSLGVTTTLDNTSVQLIDGRLDLYQLDIANPEGFESTPWFLRLKEGKGELSFVDLLHKVVEVERITLEGIEINLEHKGVSSNYGTILDNIKAFQERSDPESRRKFIIHEVVLRDITVNVSYFPIGGDATRTDLHIPEIILNEVGTSEDGISNAEIAGVLTTALLAAILHEGPKVLPDAILDGLGNGLGALGNIAQYSISIASQGFDNVGELLGSVMESIGGVFSGEKEDE